MAAHDSLSSDQFEHLGDRGVRIGERTFPAVSNDEFTNHESGHTWMRSSMIPMENGALANVEHYAHEGREGFAISAPRHQLGVGTNPQMRHLFDQHSVDIRTPQEVHGVLDDMSHQHLSEDSVKTNRNWMAAVRQVKEDDARG